jgi:predicted O-linked N-acetylglucosamine transferase (SPINDLY family)
VGKAKIRIGFVSGDLCTHAVGLLLPLFLGGIDKNSFELIAFDFSPEDGSQTRKTLKATFTEFYSIKGVTDEQAAELIKSKQVDVLFDMHGLSSGARPKIFAMRPCGIQVSWLGYIGTTSFPWLDYILVDRVVFPPSLSKTFTETPLYVEGSFIPINQIAPLKITRSSDSLGEVVLGCLNNVYKINREVFGVWMNVLKLVKSAKLVLLEDNLATKTKLLDEVLKYDIPPNRVKFFKRGTYASYKEQLSKIDIYLDTFPYCAGSTARDVVNSGTVMLTLKGRSLVSRMGASILSEMGIEDLISDNLSDYRERLIDLSTDHGYLNSCRKRFHFATTESSLRLSENISSFHSAIKSITL